MDVEDGPAGTDGEEAGYLAAYGVLIVPPSSEDGGWFVTLSEWDEDAERYSASMDGPMFDSEEAAFESARDLLQRIAASGEDDDLMKMWEAYQAGATKDEPWNQPQGNPHWRGW
jgi:hypothetical protein